MQDEKLSLGQPIGEGRTAELYPWGVGRALKLFREWVPADWVAYEARLARTVQGTGLPVPEVGDVVEIGGRVGIVYQRVEGLSMLRVFQERPWTLVSSARKLAELHAQIHTQRCAELPDLRTRLEGKIRSAEPLPVNLREAALEVLAGLPPGERVCHGDFHPDNVIISAGGPVIIDWMDAARGNPLADVARTCLLIRLGEPEEMSPPARMAYNTIRRWYQSVYIGRYFDLQPGDDGELRAWLLPVTAGRLSEDIPQERDRVLTLVRKLAS